MPLDGLRSEGKRQVLFDGSGRGAGPMDVLSRRAVRKTMRDMSTFRVCPYKRTIFFFCVVCIVVQMIRTRTSSEHRENFKYTQHEHKQNERNPYAISGSRTALGKLLQKVAVPDAKGHSFVVVISVNYAFRELALNFICNLKRLSVHNYLVLAMDEATFSYLAQHDAKVFFRNIMIPSNQRKLQAIGYIGHQKNGENVSTDNSGGIHEHIFGSHAFIETSWRKSEIVLTVLKLGINVLFSDVDVIWVRDPTIHMTKHSADIVLQSDVTKDERNLPLNFNLNSGLYYARSNKRTVKAFEAIIKYGRAIRRSEQKAFNYVLCGAFKTSRMGPGLRIGTSKCMYRRSKAIAILLPLEKFPNGNDKEFWSTKIPSSTKSQVVAAHANYVRGTAAKIARIRNAGYWHHSLGSANPDGCTITRQG